MGEIQPDFRHPDMFHRLGGGDRDQQRAGVRQPDVLTRVDHHPASDVARVLPRLEHPREPEQCSSGSEPRMLLMNALITS